MKKHLLLLLLCVSIFSNIFCNITDGEEKVIIKESASGKFFKVIGAAGLSTACAINALRSWNKFNVDRTTVMGITTLQNTGKELTLTAINGLGSLYLSLALALYSLKSLGELISFN